MKKRKINLARLLFVVAILIVMIILIVNIVSGINKAFKGSVPEKTEVNHLVRGVDLSAYQGEIDWEMLADQKIDFAFIKATESSDYVDMRFKYNWENSQQTNMKIGAYHFLTFDSSGKDQAKNFIDNVPASKKNLPPVVDLELYGDYEKRPLEQDRVRPILDECLEELEAHYKVKPIIYTNQRAFGLYIGADYTDYKIWIVDLDNAWPATLQNGETFTFWQYSHRGMLSGYKGTEVFIDMNLYNGTYDEFIAEFF